MGWTATQESCSTIAVRCVDDSLKGGGATCTQLVRYTKSPVRYVCLYNECLLLDKSVIFRSDNHSWWTVPWFATMVCCCG